MACSYCYQDEIKVRSGKIKKETLNSIYKFIEKELYDYKYELLNICYIGGEPLLNVDEIIYFEKKISNLKERIAIQRLIVTNGYLMSKEICMKLKEHSVEDYQVTLDGGAKTHDKYRYLHSKKGTYKEIMNNIREVESLCSVHVNVNLNEETVEGLPELLKDLKGMNVGVGFSLVFKSLNACKSQVSFSEGSLEIWEVAHVLAMKEGYRFTPFYRDRKSTCFYNSNNAYIFGPTGEIYSCFSGVGTPNFEIGNVLEGKSDFYYLKKSQCIEGDELRKECKACEI